METKAIKFWKQGKKKKKCVFLNRNPTSLLGMWMHVLKKRAKSRVDSYLNPHPG